MARHRSSATPLAWLYAALIGYASLYPFSGWRPTGAPLMAFLVAPWSRYWTAFDILANLIGYMPLGALIFGALVRSGREQRMALALAVGLGFTLSLTLETLQNFLPYRVPSNVDLALNLLGSAAGAALGLAVHLLGLVDRWQAVRERWLISRSAGGLTLLLLWPLGLLFPTPVPLGMGQVLMELQSLVGALFEGGLAEEWVRPWLTHDATRHSPLPPSSELLAIALGLLAPCLIGFVVSPRGWRRVVLVGGALLLGIMATTLSTALNFGPQHAFAWLSTSAERALGVGALLALMLAPLPRRLLAGLGLVVLTALVTLVAQAPADPYFAQSLHGWEQGRFIRFHGASRWVGWLWPYVAMSYLLARLTARE